MVKKHKSKDKPHKRPAPKPSGKAQSKPGGRRPNLFGTHAVTEAWLNPERNIETLYITPQARNGFEATLKEAQNRGLKRPPLSELDKDRLDTLLPRGAVHQGLALVANNLPELTLQDLLIKAETQDNPLILILDQVTDPHNVGAILRSACAFGATGVVMQRKHAPELNGVLAKTACGAVEHIPVAYETNLSRAIEELKDNHFFAYGLDERGDQVVGLIPFHVERGHIEGLSRFTDQRELRDKVFRGFIAVSLIFRVDFIAEILTLGIKDHGDIGRMIIAQHFQQHIGEAVNRADFEPFGVGHAGLAAIGHRIIGAEDKAGAVDEVEF